MAKSSIYDNLWPLFVLPFFKKEQITVIYLALLLILNTIMQTFHTVLIADFSKASPIRIIIFISIVQLTPIIHLCINFYERTLEYSFEEYINNFNNTCFGQWRN